jgi:cell division protein ZapE
MTQLVGRRPVVAPQDLVANLVPPPHFAGASFESYAPDAEYPSQAQALAAARDFAAGVRRAARSRGGASSAGKGLYLDGGFGVGKTHLLAAMARAVGKHAAFGTFVEYTHLVGAMGFQGARAALQEFSLVCIDEFELDDPGDTLLVARLMRELTDAGVAIAATSNTLPESLGQGRFAADDFRREIQAVAAVFTVVSIDGPDYRHRGQLRFTPAADAQVAAVAAREGGVVEEWRALVADLAHVHPSRMGAYVEGVRELGLTGAGPLADQNAALRVVTLVDRLYDRDVRVVASGAPLDAIFTPEMLRGGYRKKYFRALSRLAAMSATDV